IYQITFLPTPIISSVFLFILRFNGKTSYISYSHPFHNILLTLVKTCRETLMKLSLTDDENANLEMQNTPVHIESRVGELEEQSRAATDVRDSKDILVQMSIDEDSSGNSAQEILVEGTAMSTDDSDREISAFVPHSPTSPDDTVGKKQ
ncbi:hypothetical protein SK128_012960, partial [Halocaridina rubra]